MGSPKGEAGRNDDETQHEVIIINDFYIDSYMETAQPDRRGAASGRYRVMRGGDGRF